MEDTMIDMDKIEKIRKEIERLKSTNPSEYNYQNAEGYIWALDDLLSFLDTLSEEPDKDLEEAAERFANTQNKNFLNPEIVKNIFVAGAEWKEEEMMGNAVEADANTYKDLAAGKSWAEFVVEMPTNNLGDKVKLIILGGDKFKAGDRIIYHGNGYEITGVDDKWYKVKADVPSKIPELEINAISKDNEKDIKRQE